MFTRQELNGIYDSLAKKDMPKEEFIQQAMRLTDPKLMKADAMKILSGRQQKKQIDKIIASN